jgi:hypothetical protein
MSLSGRSFDPSKPPSTGGPVVDYTLARRSVLASVRRGTLGTSDVCDAHPELLRAARNIGLADDHKCPICSHETMRHVTYVYGEQLKRNNGRVVYPEDWLTELAAEHDQFTCYVVEVCTDCAWNHLVRSYMAGRNYRPISTKRRSRSQGS